MNKYMNLAINEAIVGIHKGHGGPFGCVIVKDGKVIAKEHNRVLKNNDPTYHGEVGAIRKACKKLKTYDLSGCELYTTGEPCPMCFCACLWANITKVYYGCTLENNTKIGFKDNDFYEIINNSKKNHNYFVNLDKVECEKLFEEYNDIKNKKNY